MTVASADSGGGGSDRGGLLPVVAGFDLEEMSRRNPIAVGMDLLYLVTTGFFGFMLVQTRWTAAIAAFPVAALLYFGWHSSRPFFLAQVLTILAVAAAGLAGVTLV